MSSNTYTIGSKIGQGSYASVYKAKCIDPITSTSIELACKIFDKDTAPVDYLCKFFPRELQILRQIENPHIVHIFGIAYNGPKVFIFMTYARNGDLLNYLQTKGAIKENKARVWFKQIADGLKYLHDKNIAHRDLKCENILLTEYFDTLITDFGFARYCVDSKNKKILSSTFCGSAAYASPEIIAGVLYDPKIADIWSLGIILFAILNSTMPFDDTNLGKLLESQIAKNYKFSNNLFFKLSISVKFLLRNILEPDPKIRYSLHQIMNHEWMHRNENPYH